MENLYLIIAGMCVGINGYVPSWGQIKFYLLF
jgi:hypothetical protein